MVKFLFFLKIAKDFGIKYSTAKAIIRVYKSEGRINKKTKKIHKKNKLIVKKIKFFALNWHFLHKKGTRRNNSKT